MCTHAHQIAEFFQVPAQFALTGRFFRPKARANLAVLSGKPMNISYLDDVQFLLTLSLTWDCLFRRRTQPGHHFRSQFQLGNEWIFNLNSLDRGLKMFLQVFEFNDKIQLMENFAGGAAPIPFSTKNSKLETRNLRGTFHP
ncbi:MAG: hypothetical protein ACHQ2F_07825 [Desulfobaccales bacterium]